MQQLKFPYKRVLIIGNGGAGKSTLAVKISEKFKLPAVHLDRLWWLEGWRNRSEEQFDELLDKQLEKSEWVIDGNYRRTFSHRLEYADFCIFLDYPAKLCIESVYARAEHYRGRTRPDMADGCEERVDGEFECWVNEFGEKVRPIMLSELERSSVPYKIFGSREETAAWLDGFENN